MKSSSPSSFSSVALRAAIYARVSSDRQAQEQTIDSQVSALRERVAATDTRSRTSCASLMMESAAPR